MVSQDASRQSLAESIAMSSRIMLEREGREDFFLQFAECYSFSRSLPSPFLHPIPMSLSLLISFSIYNIYLLPYLHQLIHGAGNNLSVISPSPASLQDNRICHAYRRTPFIHTHRSPFLREAP